MAHDAERRMNRLLGTDRWKTAYAHSVGLSRETVSKWFADGREPPQEFLAVLEFMEATAARRWPDRFVHLRVMRRRNVLEASG